MTSLSIVLLRHCLNELWWTKNMKKSIVLLPQPRVFLLQLTAALDVVTMNLYKCHNLHWNFRYSSPLGIFLVSLHSQPLQENFVLVYYFRAFLLSFEIIDPQIFWYEQVPFLVATDFGLLLAGPLARLWQYPWEGHWLVAKRTRHDPVCFVPFFSHGKYDPYKSQCNIDTSG